MDSVTQSTQPSALREVFFKIKLEKLEHSIPHQSVLVDDEGLVPIPKPFEFCEDIEYSYGYVSQNSQNLTMADAGFILSFEETVDQEKHFQLIQSALNSNAFVDALETIPALKKKCALFGVNGNFGHQNESETGNRNLLGEYEVERILDHDTVKHLYLIKWQGYDLEFNTWEPIDHLTSVSDLVYDFRLMERSVSKVNKVAYKKLILLNCLLDEFISPANEDPYVLLKLDGKSASDYKQEDLLKLKNVMQIKRAPMQKFLMGDARKFRLNYCRVFDKTMNDLRINAVFGSVEKLQEATRNRKRFFRCLKDWECNINRKITQEEGFAPIQIENHCDFDLPPEEFIYITKCKPGPDVQMSQEPSWFCNCDEDCFSNTQTCCPSINGSKHMYTKHGILKNLQQSTIFECNAKCNCSLSCSNRVIQNSRKVWFLILIEILNIEILPV